MKVKYYEPFGQDGDKSLKPENLEAIQSGEELYVTWKQWDRMVGIGWLGSDGWMHGAPQKPDIRRGPQLQL